MMKKTFFMLVVLLTAAMSMQAQSLLGTWKSDPEVDDDGTTTIWFFTFKQNSELTLKMQMSTNDDEIGFLQFTESIPGTFKRVGKILTLDLDAKKGTGKIDKLEFSAEMKKVFKDAPELEKTITDMLKKTIEEEVKKGFAESAVFNSTITIVKLTSTELVFDEDGEAKTYTRIR